MGDLSEIRPRRLLRVMDLVEQAGLDVSDWANYKRGAQNPSANPRYCYSWAFVQPPRPSVLSLWYDTMREEGGRVVKSLNMRKLAASWSRETSKGVLAMRARALDRAIEEAYRDATPVRVIVCDRNPKSPVVRAERRLLDAVPWAITSYDVKTGDCTLARGASPEPFVDQFCIDDTSTPARVSRDVDVFLRSPEVRRNVRNRALGKCELCGAPGFKMQNGSVYLETHHVIPLSEGGKDHESNVAVLCPNHHREAHHGAKKAEMRSTLLRKIAAKVRRITRPAFGRLVNGNS